MATKSAEETETCSRCEKPLDTTGTPGWCRACRATYQREYKSLQKQMSETRGFASGVSAAKAFVASEFETAIRGATINGFEAARLVRACKGPALPAS
jgi:hypothetical protein